MVFTCWIAIKVNWEAHFLEICLFVSVWLFPFDFEANVLFPQCIVSFLSSWWSDGSFLLASFHFECLVSWKLNNLPRRRCEFSIDGGLSRFLGKEIRFFASFYSLLFLKIVFVVWFCRHRWSHIRHYFQVFNVAIDYDFQHYFIQ